MTGGPTPRRRDSLLEVATSYVVFIETNKGTLRNVNFYGFIEGEEIVLTNEPYQWKVKCEEPKGNAGVGGGVDRVVREVSTPPVMAGNIHRAQGSMVVYPLDDNYTHTKS